MEYQNSSVDSTKLILGNYKIETSPYASAAGSFTWVNLGAGMVNSFGHNFEKFDVQAGNAPDPIEGVSKETFPIEMELIEYDASVMAAVSSGLVTSASTGTVMTLYGGGNTTLTPRAIRLTNTRSVSGATKQTIITVFKSTINQGPQFTAKSDNDTDPINVMPLSITGEIDSTRSVGTQLYTITKTI
jgi:hypothetical protein